MLFLQSEDSLSFSKAVLKKWKDKTVTLVLSEVIKEVEVSLIYTVPYLTVLSMPDPRCVLQSALVCLEQHC